MSMPPAEPSTHELLRRVLERLDNLEAKVDHALDRVRRAEAALEQAPTAAAAVVDAADAFVADARDRGIDIEERARSLLEVVVRLTEPDTMRALGILSGHLGALAPMLEGLPAAASASVDAFDEWVRRAADSGTDVEALLTNTVTAASQVSTVLHSPEFTALMNTGVLAPSTLEVIGRAGQALAETQSRKTEPVGLFGALRAASRPEVQQVMGFAITFAQCFGDKLRAPSANGALAPRH